MRGAATMTVTQVSGLIQQLPAELSRERAECRNDKRSRKLLMFAGENASPASPEPTMVERAVSEPVLWRGGWHIPAKGKPYQYSNKDCYKRLIVTTNTFVYVTNRTSEDWIFAIYSVLTARNGVEARQFWTEFGCQYLTASHMLGRVREVRGQSDCTLTNVTGADETCFGGRD